MESASTHLDHKAEGCIAQEEPQPFGCIAHRNHLKYPRGLCTEASREPTSGWVERMKARWSREVLFELQEHVCHRSQHLPPQPRLDIIALQSQCIALGSLHPDDGGGSLPTRLLKRGGKRRKFEHRGCMRPLRWCKSMRLCGGAGTQENDKIFPCLAD
eukprot:g31271.t1